MCFRPLHQKRACHSSIFLSFTKQVDILSGEISLILDLSLSLPVVCLLVEHARENLREEKGVFLLQHSLYLRWKGGGSSHDDDFLITARKVSL